MNFVEKRERLVQRLVSSGVLRNKKVTKAMLAVPREEFVPSSLRDQAYVDTPLHVGYGQTISAPHMVAIMCQELDLKPGQKVLEIGTGSGYHAAVTAETISTQGSSLESQLFSLEIVPELIAFAEDNLQRTGYADQVMVVEADGSQGYIEEAPFDRIYATAAPPSVPAPLIDQLKLDGILIMPVGEAGFFQELLKIEKKRVGEIVTRRLGGVAFVPMRGKYGLKP
ncbi:protein-L-isoaspartate O-methyltransferase [Candidatus Bathyarchaeota archaeon]|nr:protein-L-isoaspartate O-methyltransferase [Candidatus Bathyarchaeota archaeon]